MTPRPELCSRSKEPRWTKEQIRAARITPLLLILEALGLRLVEHGAGNWEPADYPGLYFKAHYWRWPALKIRAPPEPGAARGRLPKATRRARLGGSRASQLIHHRLLYPGEKALIPRCDGRNYRVQRSAKIIVARDNNTPQPATTKTQPIFTGGKSARFFWVIALLSKRGNLGTKPDENAANYDANLQPQFGATYDLNLGGNSWLQRL